MRAISHIGSSSRWTISRPRECPKGTTHELDAAAHRRARPAPAPHAATHQGRRHRRAWGRMAGRGSPLPGRRAGPRADPGRILRARSQRDAARESRHHGGNPMTLAMLLHYTLQASSGNEATFDLAMTIGPILMVE